MKPGLILFLVTCSSLAAQTPRSNTPPTLVAHGYIAFSVQDMDASAKWYTDKLGLATLFRAPRTEAVHAGAIFLQGGGLFVELVQVDEATDLSRYLTPRQVSESGGRQYIHGLFKAGAVVDDFAKAVGALRARGVEIVALQLKKSRDEPATVTLRDNAGNLIPLLDGSFNPSTAP